MTDSELIDGLVYVHALERHQRTMPALIAGKFNQGQYMKAYYSIAPRALPTWDGDPFDFDANAWQAASIALDMMSFELLESWKPEGFVMNSGKK